MLNAIASVLLALAIACLLGGCATREPALLPLFPGGSSTVELSVTPFHPGTDPSFGPAALTMMLSASGVSATPAELASLLYSPTRHDLVGTVAALPARFGRLAYRIAPDLPALLVELAAGHPVLVQLSRGRSLLSKWHFAVVIGYDIRTDTILVSAGKRERQRARDFMRAWSNADRWGILVLRPGELPAAVSTEDYLQAAIEFEPTLDRRTRCSSSRPRSGAGLTSHSRGWAGQSHDCRPATERLQRATSSPRCASMARMRLPATGSP